MTYSVDNIIPVNLYLTAAGLGYGDFSSALIFAGSTDLKSGVTFAVDTWRDYSSLNEIAEDFSASSDIYLIATRYFTQIPKPKSVTIWMKNAADASLLDTVNKAEDEVWRYHFFFKNSDLTKANLLQLADWSDAESHPIWVTTSEAGATSASSTTDIAAVMAAKGNRHIFMGYRLPAAIVADSSQAYTMVQLAATFNKFKPNAKNSAITAEYQVLTGIAGDDLKTSSYSALKSKNCAFFTEIELSGETDSLRAINTRSMSSYNEFIDDVINLDVLKNHLQVDGYNYITGTSTKRALTPAGYAGLLTALTTTCKRFYDNGVLGKGTYVDPKTGEVATAENGFVILGKPEDVFNLTDAQRKAREYPATTIYAILARAGHVAEINVYIE
ncbi:DUF3383 family protein [Phytobacter diazotrophicus]|jgi:hypothetical protein|uniref:DUF3383 family protein n=2 Tax=Enterobacteriaceae TaxID=543 RepID=A0ABW1Q1P5_9ENTR|nr:MULTISPECIES: DUF3383 family protein [Phytobacter]MBS6739353.1 DUF3383 family protein [Enterobacteriaceae bacterium]PXW60659.1 uncharacterized protein DUF3383 [Grimontella sp. AG753]QIH64215.1 hypothetical protein CRX67_14605 [Enterobacteriaceae bacterium A-F18]MDU4152730.1 DUF3383 family protein [Enterobacteriaceae bacterium]MDU4353027.1 DUF3383 family protein [Phytobacter diazotrophicus]